MFWDMRKFITDVLGYEEIPYNMKLYPCTEIVNELMWDYNKCPQCVLNQCLL